jgi:hypothetical protein
MLRANDGEGEGAGSTGVLLISLYGVMLSLALLARFIWLDSVPGVNGDEAWYGVWVEKLLQGKLWNGMGQTGILPNPFYIIPLAAVQAMADPAPWVLRVPPLISGLAFIIVGYAGLRSTIGARPAFVFALLAATTPVTLTYSRSGWVSQTLLATVILLWACLAGKKVVALLSLSAALLVHPTNVFLLPIPVAFWLKDFQSFLAKVTGNVKLGVLISAMLIGGTLTAILVSLWMRWEKVEKLLTGRYSPDSLPHHFFNALLKFGDLFSGIAVYRDEIVGDPVGLTVHRVIISCALGVLALTLFCGVRTRRDPRITTLLVGLATSVIAFLIIGGPSGLRAERYALFMVAPVLVLLSASLARPFNVTSRAGLWFALFLGSAALISIWFNYFEPLRISGGQARDTETGAYRTAAVEPEMEKAQWTGRAYRTAAVEPKMQVAQWAKECMQHHNNNVTFFAESFWLARPLQYYLFYEPKISVKQLGFQGFPPEGERHYALSEVPSSHAIVGVYSGSDLDQQLRNMDGSPEKTIFDAAARPFIQIYTRGLSC